ncbi:MAG: nickel pincer cofactor biosynthesis protein LarC [Nitrospirota bacterium]
MKIAYFDCFSGISGDMLLGAIVDAGAEINRLRSELSLLDIKELDISSEMVYRGGIKGTKVDVFCEKCSCKEGFSDEKSYAELAEIIKQSGLDNKIKEESIDIFDRLAETEANIHGKKKASFHFHGSDAIDIIADISGTVIGLHLLGVEKVVSSPVNMGSGFVDTRTHGRLPIPAPATAELLKGCPVYSRGIEKELTTPTGAAIISRLAKEFGSFPMMRIEKVGYGAGSYTDTLQPDMLRLFIGESVSPLENDAVIQIETNIDDMIPQIYEYLIEKLLSQGALDVYLTPIIMKKSRPATMVTILANKEDADHLIDIIFKETTTIGIRIKETERKKIYREISKIKTRSGEIGVKVVSKDGEVLNIIPEYDDCKKIADDTNLPLKKVIEEARSEALLKVKK